MRRNTGVYDNVGDKRPQVKSTLKPVSDLRFSSSACTKDAALDRTSNGVSMPGWSLEKEKREFKKNAKDSFRILVVNN